MKRAIVLIAILIFLISIGWKTFKPGPQFRETEKVKISTEESVVIDAVDKVSPSVVTVGIEKSRIDPFGSFFRPRTRQENIKQDIGSGFVVAADGLVVTNKHVVSDTEAKYNVVTKDDKKFEVKKIYRDPANDLAILKIDTNGLTPIELGDSTKLKVGQMAIAIGTALGEFRSTVTVGVISGLGRGINAGSPFEGSVERLDNVIQTDAAINPGNSGGPLINSSGQVIGINTAVAAEGQNIGFAIPINVIKDGLNNFNQTGKFSRPFIGVRYQVISRDSALLNELPEGAYVREVVANSPADKAGIKLGDIITKIDDTRLIEGQELAKIISGKKIGDRIRVEVWQDGKTRTVDVTLGESNS